jgi:hypothetical protein
MRAQGQSFFLTSQKIGDLVRSSWMLEERTAHSLFLSLSLSLSLSSPLWFHRDLELNLWMPYERQTTPQLFCIPQAGMGAWAFQGAWSDALSPCCQVVPIELAGHNSRFQEEPETDLLRLASNMADSITAARDKSKRS